MTQKIVQHPLVFKLMAMFALLFGVMTIRSGGMALFTGGAVHQAAGNYVPSLAVQKINRN